MDFFYLRKRTISVWEAFMSGNLFFQGMMYLITLVFGGWLIAYGQMEVADLAMYALLYRNLYQSDSDSCGAD